MRRQSLAPRRISRRAVRDSPRWVLAALSLWIAAPAGGADPARVDQYLRQTPAFLHDRSLAALRALGPLQHEHTRTLTDPYDPIRVNEYRTLVFEGLTIDGLVVSGQDLWPTRVTVTTAGWEMPERLNVGSAIEHVVAVLGAPSGSTPAVLAYPGASESVNFSVHNDRIIRIELIYDPE